MVSIGIGTVPEFAACMQVIVEFIAGWRSLKICGNTHSLEETSRLPHPGGHLSDAFCYTKDSMPSSHKDDGIKAVKVRIILHLQAFEDIHNVNQCTFSFQ